MTSQSWTSRLNYFSFYLSLFTKSLRGLVLVIILLCLVIVVASILKVIEYLDQRLLLGQPNAFENDKGIIFIKFDCIKIFQ